MAPLLHAAKTSEAKVGQTKATIVDSIARVIDVFGVPSLDIYLFSRPVDASVKATLASMPNLNFSFIAEKTGHAPVLNLQVFFDNGTKKCMESKVLSYYTVFEKSQAFPFEAGKDSGISFNTDRREGGVADVTCEFATGSPFRIKVQRRVMADRDVFPSLLPPGKGSLTFSWDIDFTGEVNKGL